MLTQQSDTSAMMQASSHAEDEELLFQKELQHRKDKAKDSKYVYWKCQDYSITLERISLILAECDSVINNHYCIEIDLSNTTLEAIDYLITTRNQRMPSNTNNLTSRLWVLIVPDDKKLQSNYEKLKRLAQLEKKSNFNFELSIQAHPLLKELFSKDFLNTIDKLPITILKCRYACLMQVLNEELFFETVMRLLRHPYLKDLDLSGNGILELKTEYLMQVLETAQTRSFSNIRLYHSGSGISSEQEKFFDQMKEESKTWDNAQKKRFFKLQLSLFELKRAYSALGYSEKPIVFPDNEQDTLDMLSEFLNQHPRLQDTIKRWAIEYPCLQRLNLNAKAFSEKYLKATEEPKEYFCVLIEAQDVEKTEGGAQIIRETLKEKRETVKNHIVQYHLKNMTAIEAQEAGRFISQFDFGAQSRLWLNHSQDGSLIAHFLENFNNPSINALRLFDISCNKDSIDQLIQVLSAKKKCFSTIEIEKCELSKLDYEALNKLIIQLSELGIKTIQLNYEEFLTWNVIDLNTMCTARQQDGIEILWFKSCPPTAEEKDRLESSFNTLAIEQRLALSEMYYKSITLYKNPDDDDKSFASLCPDQEEQCYALLKNLSDFFQKTQPYSYAPKMAWLLKRLLPLSPEKTLEFLKERVRLGEYYDMRTFLLEDEQKLDLILYASERLPYIFIELAQITSNLKLPMHLQAINDIFSIWQALDEAEDGASESFEKVASVYIPKMRKLCERELPTMTFLEHSLDKIEEMHKREEEFLLPIVNMISWFSWATIKLLRKQPLIDMGSLDRIFKEFLNFASPMGRFQLTSIFLDVICNNPKNRYSALIQDKGSHALLPAMALSQILLQNEDEENSEGYFQKAQQLLNVDTLGLYQGHHFRTLAFCFVEVACEKTLSACEKLDLLLSVFSKSSELEECLKKTPPLVLQFVEEFGTSFQATNKPLIEGSVFCGKIPTPEERKTLKDNRLALIETMKEFIFKFRTRVEPQKALCDLITALSPKTLAGYISESRDSLRRFLNLFFNEQMALQFREKEFKMQLYRLMTVQGFSQLGVVSQLTEVSSEDFSKQARQVLQNLLSLTNEQLTFYDELFSTWRNPGALLGYYAKIKTIEQSAKGLLVVNLFKHFIHVVLSKDSIDFYAMRYLKKPGSHLEACFSQRPELERQWKLGRRENFYDFFIENSIEIKEFSPDFEKFIQSKIFGHNHIDPKHFKDLELFLNTENESEKEKMYTLAKDKTQKLKEEMAKQKPASSEYYRVKGEHSCAAIEVCLMALLQAPIDPLKTIQQRYQDHIKLLDKIESLIDNVADSGPFERDVSALRTALKNNGLTLKTQDWAGWHIVDTDHPWDLFMAGTDIEGSCQNVDAHISTSKCLLAYPMDGKNRMIAIQDETGTTMVRAIIRLFPEGNLYLEEFYPTNARPGWIEALKVFAIERANDLGVRLLASKGEPDSPIYTLPLKCIPRPDIPFEYVDALFGIQEEAFEITESSILFEAPLLTTQPMTFNWDTWKEKYHQQYPERAFQGYGPGALIACKP